jgi:hypothetical protein
MTYFIHVGDSTRYQIYQQNVQSLFNILNDLSKSKKYEKDFNNSLYKYWDHLTYLKEFDNVRESFSRYGDLEKRLFCLYTPDGKKQLISVSSEKTTYWTIWNMSYSLLGIEGHNIIGDEKHINNIHLYMGGHEEPIELCTQITDMLPNDHDISTITPIFVIIEITITEIPPTPSYTHIHYSHHRASDDTYIGHQNPCIKWDIILKINDTPWEWECVSKKLELDDLQINSSDIIIRNNFVKNKKCKKNVFYISKQNATKHSYRTHNHQTNCQIRSLRY